jgi:hypothetical protein
MRKKGPTKFKNEEMMPQKLIIKFTRGPTKHELKGIKPENFFLLCK